MDRIIEVKVSGGYLSVDGRKAGNQHEANATRLRITFDPSWDGYAKTVTFWNANGMHQVKRTLTADRLEDQSKNARVYLCPIPGEAMTESGLMTFTIDGYVNGVRQRTAGANLGVDRSPYTENAADPADPTPSQAEQLQVQIENLLGDVKAETLQAEIARAAAELAQLGAEQARSDALAIIEGQIVPEITLKDKADLVNGKVPKAQLPTLTADDVGAVPGSATYYATATNMSADDLLVPFAIIPVSDTVNAALYAICGSSFAYVRTSFYGSPSITGRRMQIACTYNDPNPRLAMRIYGGSGWTAWKRIADGMSAVSKTGDTMTGILQVAMGGGNATVVADPACAYIQAFRDNSWDNRRTLLLRTKETSPDMTNALAISSAGADAAEYTVLHTGNLQLLSGLMGGGKVKVGSYTGTGAYGGTSPNTIELDFEPDMVIVQDAGMNGAMVWGMWIRGCLMFMSYTNTYSCFVQDSGRNFKWASTASAAGQFNSSGVAYGYMAIKFG